MEISQGVRDRIFAVADAIYAETDRRSFPIVDAVRKRARVNMNDASACMKEWRRSQTTTFNPVPALLPPELQASCTNALSALWQEATKMANESLRTAQTGWEAERADADDLSRQMATAYDLQASELIEAQDEISRLKAQIEAMHNDSAKIRSSLDAAERDRTLANNAATEAALRAHEIERRADDLQKSLDHAYQETSNLRGEMVALRGIFAEQMEGVRREARIDLESERSRVEHQRESFQAAATQALAEAAHLRGKLEALEFRQAKAARRGKATPNGEADRPKNT